MRRAAALPLTSILRIQGTAAAERNYGRLGSATLSNHSPWNLDNGIGPLLPTGGLG